MDPDEDEPLSPGLSSWISNLTLATSSLEVEDYVPSSARRRSTPHVVTPSAIAGMHFDTSGPSDGTGSSSDASVDELDEIGDFLSRRDSAAAAKAWSSSKENQIEMQKPPYPLECLIALNLSTKHGFSSTFTSICSNLAELYPFFSQLGNVELQDRVYFSLKSNSKWFCYSDDMRQQWSLARRSAGMSHKKATLCRKRAESFSGSSTPVNDVGTKLVGKRQGQLAPTQGSRKRSKSLTDGALLATPHRLDFEAVLTAQSCEGLIGRNDENAFDYLTGDNASEWSNASDMMLLTGFDRCSNTTAEIEPHISKDLLAHDPKGFSWLPTTYIAEGERNTWA